MTKGEVKSRGGGGIGREPEIWNCRHFGVGGVMFCCLGWIFVAGVML